MTFSGLLALTVGLGDQAQEILENNLGMDGFIIEQLVILNNNILDLRLLIHIHCRFLSV